MPQTTSLTGDEFWGLQQDEFSIYLVVIDPINEPRLTHWFAGALLSF